MLQRPSTAKIAVLNMVTLGLYFFYWSARSRQSIHVAAKQQLIPTTWMLAVPFARVWWAWKYAEALEFVSYKRIRSSDTFLVYLLAINAWLILPFLNFFNLFAPNITTSRDAVITVVVLAALYTIIQAVGTSFFCIYTQNKINATKNQVAAVL